MAAKKTTVKDIKESARQDGHAEGYAETVRDIVKRMRGNVDRWVRYKERGRVPLSQPESMNELADVFEKMTSSDPRQRAARATVETGTPVAGNKTLFRRGEIWLSIEAAEELDLAKGVENIEKLKVIERFSDDYFELIRKNTTDENRIMATQRPGEELIIKLRGTFYRIK